MTTRQSGIHEIRPGFHLECFLSLPKLDIQYVRVSAHECLHLRREHRHVSAQSVPGTKVVDDNGEAEDEDDH